MTGTIFLVDNAASSKLAPRALATAFGYVTTLLLWLLRCKERML
jgi:hypothetical protein